MDDLRAMQLQGLDVNHCVKRLANTHTKGIIVDGRRVLIGSHNWSTDGVTQNRDASLILDDRQIGQYFLDVFETDWKRATALKLDVIEPESAPRIPDPGQPPARGFVRMTLAEYQDR